MGANPQHGIIWLQHKEFYAAQMMDMQREYCTGLSEGRGSPECED